MPDQRAPHDLRPVLVLGLLPAGLALVRSLGRAGIPVYGGVFRRNEFGLRSRFLKGRCIAEASDERTRDRRLLAFLHEIAAGRRAVVFPERDEHVDFVLRNQDEIAQIADMPLPRDGEIASRLRRKDLLPTIAAHAGIPAPKTIYADSEDAIRGADVEPPFLLKSVEGQDYALTFGHKAVVATSVDEALSVWREARDAGFEMILQELIPDSYEHVYSLFTYVGRSGEPLASVVGRKVRQGPLRFGTSAVFEVRYDPQVLELGEKLLASAGYTGLAHIEFARDPRDGLFKVLEVNTRTPVWGGIAMSRSFDMAHVAYDDLCGIETRSLGTYTREVAWIYLAKDLWVSAQMARRRELSPHEFLVHYVRPGKARAIFAADDPLPALASVGYLRSRLG